MNDILSPATIVLVVAVCTFATRFLPFALFGGKRQVSRDVQYLGQRLPSAVIAILVIYCLKSINILDINSVAPQLISVAIVAALHIWRRNNLLSIGVGTVVYMVLVQFVFI